MGDGRSVYGFLTPDGGGGGAPPPARPQSKPTLDIEARKTRAKEMAMVQALFNDGSDVTTNRHPYKVDKMITVHTFGYTFKATQKKSNEVFYMKTEPDTQDPNVQEFKVLSNELTVLKALKNAREDRTKFFPHLGDMGVISKRVKYLFVTPFGVNLSDARKNHGKKYKPETAFRVSRGMFQAVHDLHRCGYIHRCLKPKSFAVGVGKQKNTILLIDFGMAMRYRDEKNGEHIKPGRLQRFAGLMRYAPRASHQLVEHSRKDDLESWFYMSLELFDDKNLPWRSSNDDAKVLKLKEKYTTAPNTKSFAVMGVQYRNIWAHIVNLEFESTPDYDCYMELMDAVCEDKKIPKDDKPFEFDTAEENSGKDGSGKDGSGGSNEDDEK